MEALSTKFGRICHMRSSRIVAVLALAVATAGGVSPAFAQGGGKKSKEPPGPDPLAEIEKVKVELEQRLADQEAASKGREEAIRKEQAAAVDAARDEVEQRMSADRNERRAEVLRLQKALEATAAREDARERNAPPSVGANSAGLSLYGYVQADYQLRQSSEDQLNTGGQPLNQDRFLIRRARLGLIMDRHYGEGFGLPLARCGGVRQTTGEGRGRATRGDGDDRHVQDPFRPRGAPGRPPAPVHGTNHGSAGALSG